METSRVQKKVMMKVVGLGAGLGLVLGQGQAQEVKVGQEAEVVVSVVAEVDLVAGVEVVVVQDQCLDHVQDPCLGAEVEAAAVVAVAVEVAEVAAEVEVVGVDPFQDLGVGVEAAADHLVGQGHVVQAGVVVKVEVMLIKEGKMRKKSLVLILTVIETVTMEAIEENVCQRSFTFLTIVVECSKFGPRFQSREKTL